MCQSRGENMFNNKKYWILMPPFLIVAMALFIYLPQDYKPYSFFAIFAFWIIYHFWNYIEKKSNQKMMAGNSPNGALL